MDLGTAPLFDLTAPAVEADETGAATRSEQLLVSIRDRRAAIADHEIGLVREIAEWAAEHVVDDEANAATLTERGLDTGLPVAGPGAPLISDFAVMELSALLGRSLDSGRSYVGQVVELAYRLPKTWARVLTGEVPVWKALRIADSTRLLPLDAASFVDAQLAPFADGCTWAQIDRLVETALVRFDPAAAEETSAGRAGAPAREHRPGPGRLRRCRRHQRHPRHRRRPRPRTSPRPPRQALRPARRRRLPRRTPRQSPR